MATNNWGSKFSHVAMKQLASFLSTFNQVDQTIAVDGANVYNIQSTGTGDCTINGVYIPSLPVDAELLITDTEVTTAWAANTEYSVDDEVYFGAPDGEGVMYYKCLKAHTSDLNIPPAYDKTVWQDIPNLAGQALADDFRILIMVTAEADGTLGVWRASVDTAIGTVPVAVIPYFDPSVYCVVGFIDYANDAASAEVIFGDTGGGVDFGTDGTFTAQIGPVFPAAANLPKN
jgi:hypothetical protein